MKTIGVDVGGTFTDLVLSDISQNELQIHKVPTTPDQPARGVLQGVLALCEQTNVQLEDVSYIFHGTTIATNSVLEHKGAVCGMVTNEGFRDIIHIARHQRVEHYSIMQELPWQNRPLVKRRHRKVVRGRIAPPFGDIVDPLDEDGLRTVAAQLRDDGVEAVAVCFLFSYLNASHEARARDILAEELPGVFVTSSSAIAPQFREFERFTTAALAAFVGPKVITYVSDLEQALKRAGFSGELRIMASNGGVATPAMIAHKPALTLLSGLAAGVMGGAWVGQITERKNLITFDIGGTSADIGIVTEGQFVESDSRSTSIAGFPLLLPMIDVHTIGAGGGSIAHIDPGGAFRVGPRSAGALPGPAAYGRGGTEPTVTDANVVLGRLAPDAFLGGDMRLDPIASERAVADLSQKLKLDIAETAEGILALINSNMANAIRSRTIEKGLDPRNYSLVAFGGAGPLHGAEVAASLGIPEVIVPPYPGITSAMGLLTTDLKYDSVRTQFQVSGAVNIQKLNDDLNEMERGLLAHFHADRLAAENVEFNHTADLRYVGQGYELRVQLAAPRLDDETIALLWKSFNMMHRREYGRSLESSPIEIVNLRVTGTAAMPKLGMIARPSGRSLKEAKIGSKPTVFRCGGKLIKTETPFYRRDLLPLDAEIFGPAIIIQKDSTTVVPPSMRLRSDASGCLIIKTGATA